MIIGLTGGIGSGKSTVSNLFVARGAQLIDADAIAREVVQIGSPVLSQIANAFGPNILNEDGSLNRGALATIVFRDDASKKQLEQLIHPPIRHLLLQSMTEAEGQNPHGLVVVDIPLLFESGYDQIISEIVVVYVPERIQVERLMRREKWTEEEALRRIRSQLSIEEKKQRASHVIDNCGTLQETEIQVDVYLKKLGVQL